MYEIKCQLKLLTCFSFSLCAYYTIQIQDTPKEHKKTKAFTTQRWCCAYCESFTFRLEHFFSASSYFVFSRAIYFHMPHQQWSGANLWQSHSITMLLTYVDYHKVEKNASYQCLNIFPFFCFSVDLLLVSFITQHP